ncbi:MAG: 4a-hydroxytetrahydrobiopterin dehydratase [Candidatus Limnocylindria bacterium]
MPWAPLLSDQEIDEALRTLPAWKREGETLVRTVRCPSFRDAIALVNAVADAAEAADHHPDIDIRWRRITFHLTTKAADGLTERDAQMAATIDGLVPAEATGLESPGR